MRKVRWIVALAVLWAGPFFLGHGVAQKDATANSDEFKIKTVLEVGGEARITDSTERWSKFLQFRDIPRNGTINFLHFTMGRESSPWSFSGTAIDALQLDQRYRLELEKVGRTRTTFRYTSIPSFVSRLTKAPYTYQGKGVFTLSDTIQSALQAAAPAAIPPLMNDLVLNTPYSDLRLRREQFSMKEDWTVTNSFHIFAEIDRQQRRGFRPIGLGVYERAGLPAGGFFTLKTDELIEPVDHAITDVRTGIEWHNKKALLRVEYFGSFFRNDVGSIVWDNPYQLTDQEATPPGFGVGRWRFGRGQTSLYPDNQAHSFSFLTRLDLPMDSFLSALFSYSQRTQDQPFLPWTLNTAVATTVPVGVVPTSSSTLPRSSLDGKVNVINGDLVLGTRHWKKLSITSHYRAFDYENQTPVLPLQGYVVEDSYWLSVIDGHSLGSLQQINSYLKQQASLEFIWKPVKSFRWNIEPTWEGWNRNHRQAERTNEFGGRTRIQWDPVKWFDLQADWKYGNRQNTGYIPPVLEFQTLTTGVPAGGFASGIRMYDQANRVHNNGGLVLNFSDRPGKWMVSANYGYAGDNYDERYYGLSNYVSGTAGVDVNWNPNEQFGLVTFYNYERTAYAYRQIAKGSGANLWAAANEWDRDTRDHVNSYGVTFNFSDKKQKWINSITYDLSFAETKILTANPGTVQANMVNDAVAHPFPNVKTRFQEVRLDSGYHFRPNLTGGVRYMYSPYRLDDFATDILQPYFGAPPTGVVDDVTNNFTRALFVDSRYGSYNAHMVGAYLRFTF